VKIKLLDVINSREAIKRMGERTSYDAKTSYQIAKNIKELSAELADYEKARYALIMKYGEQTKDGNTEVKKENMDIFSKELNELLSVEIELKITKISPEKLSGSSPFDLMAIEWMLELDE